MTENYNHHGKEVPPTSGAHQTMEHSSMGGPRSPQLADENIPHLLDVAGEYLS